MEKKLYTETQMGLALGALTLAYEAAIVGAVSDVIEGFRERAAGKAIEIGEFHRASSSWTVGGLIPDSIRSLPAIEP